MAAGSYGMICLVALIGASVAAQAREAGGSRTTPVRNFVLTSEQVRAFGAYTPLERVVLRPGEALHVYGEPGSFGWHTRNGGARFGITVSVRLRRSDGRAVASNVAPLSLEHAAAVPPTSSFPCASRSTPASEPTRSV